jgi:hypothetical protein
MVLLNNHLEYRKKNTMEHGQLERVQEQLRSVIVEQLPIVIDYVDIFVLVQVFNILHEKKP